MTLKMIMSFRVAIASKRDYRGKSKWYKGKIMRVNVDGTYDIEYDDGDVERRVRKVSCASLEVHQRNRHQQ